MNRANWIARKATPLRECKPRVARCYRHAPVALHDDATRSAVRNTRNAAGNHAHWLYANRPGAVERHRIRRVVRGHLGRGQHATAGQKNERARVHATASDAVVAEPNTLCPSSSVV